MTAPVERDGHPARRFADPHHDARRAVLVLGSGRSGTTKLAEALTSAGRVRLVFEPLNTALSPLSPPGFVGNGYRAPDDRDPVLADALARVLEGRFRSEWTDAHNRARFATRRVVKDISANNLVDLLRHRFPDTPIVFVHRHPLAVAASLLALEARANEQPGFVPKPRDASTVPRWAAASGLLEGPLAALAPEIHELFDQERSYVVDRTIRWCMENYVPLGRSDDPGLLRIGYEDLVDRPAEMLGAIGRFTRLDIEPGLRDFAVPSSTDWGTGVHGHDGSPEARRSSWTSRIDDHDLEASLAVVRTFGLEDRVPAI